MEIKDQVFLNEGSNYALSKFITDNGLKNLWRKESPDSSGYTHYNRSCQQYQDESHHIRLFFTDHYNGISFDRLLSKSWKILEKVNGILIILFSVKTSCIQLQIICFFMKKTKNSAKDWWEYTNTMFSRKCQDIF